MTARRRLIVLLALATTCAVVSHTVRAALGPRYGGELSIAVLDLPTLPGGPVPRGAAERLIAGLTRETLLGIDADGLPVPGLARSWSAASGGREWTLVLRDGLQFHDGHPVTADDAVRSLHRFLKSPSPAAAALADALDGGQAFRSGTVEQLPGLASPDASHLVLRFLEPAWAPFAPLAAVGAAVARADGAGCGPFAPTLQIPAKRIVLAAFAGHVRGRPFLDGVQVVGVADAVALRTEFQAGRVDVAAGEAGLSRPAAVLLLVLDPARPPFDRAEARSAVAAAVDRADLVRHLIPGGDAAATLLPPSMLTPLGDDTSSAPALVPGSVALRVSKDVPPLLSQRILAYLSRLGLEIQVEPISASEVLEGAAHLRLLVWSPEVPEPLLALRELASLAPAPPRVHEELRGASREVDGDRRRARLHRAEALLRAEHVLVPAAVIPVSYGVRSRTRGARIDLAGRLVVEDAWLAP